MRRNRQRVVWALGLFAAGAAGLAPAGAQPAEGAELRRILDLMERRQRQAGIIRIKAEGERFIPKGGHTDFFPPSPDANGEISPPQDESTELRQDVTFDFVGQRYRQQYSERLGAKFDSWVCVFDGEKNYGSKADLPVEELDNFKPSDLSVVIGGGRANRFNADWWPYLMSAGFILSAERKPFHLSDFAIPLDRENLFLHARETADGVTCSVIRVFPTGPKGQERFYEYAVGRDDGAVRRCTSWAPGPRKELEIRIGYRKVDDRPVPTGWVTEWHQSRGAIRLYKSDKMKVTTYEVDDGLATRFTLTPAVGARIAQRQYPEGIQIIRPSDEKVTHYTVDESGELVAGEIRDGAFVPNRTWGWWAAGAVLLVVGGVLARRLRRSSPSSAAKPFSGASQ